MISGRRPFGGDSYAATLRFVLYDDLQPLPAVPSQVSRVLEGALCKSPNGRYTTNCSFGGPDARRLFITEAQSILVADLSIVGRQMFSHQ